jgi:hypothetical protein
MLHPDHEPYFKFTRRQRVDLAIHTLEGILKGIAIDGQIQPAECRELYNWYNEHRQLIAYHPFSELVPVVQAALADGVISTEERDDLLWLCKNMSAGSFFYDEITNDIQVLHGMLHGILTDDVVTEEEIKALSEWIETNSHLKGTYPFDEIDSLLTMVLQDGKLDDKEKSLLKDFFEDFISYSSAKRSEQAKSEKVNKKEMRLTGICAVCPVIEFPNHVFCFTGASRRATRHDLARQVESRGGVFTNTVTKNLDYLVIGAAGNPCWAYGCYGRKVEQAIKYRREGSKLILVHENDFWDAIEDSKG